jgi:primosomal protein N' (replication factor Y)
MQFYLVGVASKSHRGTEPLTYHSEDNIPLGTVVAVPLRRSTAVGVILQKTAKPNFPTKAIIKTLAEQSLPSTSLELLTWLPTYYPSPLGTMTQLFVPASLLRKSQAKPKAKAEPVPKVAALPSLTKEQTAAVKTIAGGPAQSYMLHGVTGSGKTRVYLELAKDSLQKGRSAIILTPEIGLTPQLVQTFRRTFPDQVLTGHSALTEAERRKLWQDVLTSEKPVVLLLLMSSMSMPTNKNKRRIIKPCALPAN